MSHTPDENCRISLGCPSELRKDGSVRVEGEPFVAPTQEAGEVAVALPKKVAIVGFSELSRNMAPYADPSFEIWSLGSQMLRCPRLTRGFELHDDAFLRRVHGEKWPEFQAFLKGMKVPLYRQDGGEYEKGAEEVTLDLQAEYPAAIRYPIERASKACFGIEDPFNDERKPLWTNSIQFMLALAGIEGFSEVHVYGVDMAHRLEYVLQRHGVTYLIGLLMGQGINVYLPPRCGLMHSDHVYGYEEDPAGILDEVSQHLKRKRAERRAQRDEAFAKLHSLDGYDEAMEECIEYAEERARGGRAEKVEAPVLMV